MVVSPSFASASVAAAVVSCAVVVCAAAVSAAVVSCLEAEPEQPVTAIIALAKIAASHLLLFLIFMSPFSLRSCIFFSWFSILCCLSGSVCALHHKLHNRAISSAHLCRLKGNRPCPRQFLCQTSGRSPGLCFILRTSSRFRSDILSFVPFVTALYYHQSHNYSRGSCGGFSPHFPICIPGIVHSPSLRNLGKLT